MAGSGITRSQARKHRLTKDALLARTLRAGHRPPSYRSVPGWLGLPKGDVGPASPYRLAQEIG